MKKNLIFFILSTVLLIKQSLAETENISATKKLTIRNADIAKLATLSEEPIKLGKKLFEDAYADKSNSENVTEFLATFRKRFTKIDTDELTDKIGAFLLFDFIYEIASGRVIITDEEKKGADVLLAYKVALEKHDYKSVASESQRKFDEFLEWLTQELDAKNNKLTPVEQQRIKEFKDLCLEYKNETNLDKKGAALDDISRRVKLSYFEEYIKNEME